MNRLYPPASIRAPGVKALDRGATYLCGPRPAPVLFQGGIRDTTQTLLLYLLAGFMLRRDRRHVVADTAFQKSAIARRRLGRQDGTEWSLKTVSRPPRLRHRRHGNASPQQMEEMVNLLQHRW